MKKARLENWYLGPYDQLHGQVYGHPDFTDGTYVCTSRVASLDLKTGKAITRNTEYELGKEVTSETGESNSKGNN